MKKIITCLLATLGLTTACGQGNFKNMDIESFAALTEDPNTVVLDVRTAEEFKDLFLENISCYYIASTSSDDGFVSARGTDM